MFYVLGYVGYASFIFLLFDKYKICSYGNYPHVNGKWSCSNAFNIQTPLKLGRNIAEFNARNTYTCKLWLYNALE